MDHIPELYVFYRKKGIIVTKVCKLKVLQLIIFIIIYCASYYVKAMEKYFKH